MTSRLSRFPITRSGRMHDKPQNDYAKQATLKLARIKSRVTLCNIGPMPGICSGEMNSHLQADSVARHIVRMRKSDPFDGSPQIFRHRRVDGCGTSTSRVSSSHRQPRHTKETGGNVAASGRRPNGTRLLAITAATLPRRIEYIILLIDCARALLSPICDPHLRSNANEAQ